MCFASVRVCVTRMTSVSYEVAVQWNAMIVTQNRKDFVGAEELGVIVRTPAEFLRMLRESQ